MSNLTSASLVRSISQLGTTNIYAYYSGKTKIRITEIVGPEGPIKFLRWDSNSSPESAASASISYNQLATVASVFSRRPNFPIHFDRLFSGGGNSRSALETLLALTPNFFICYPQKTNPYTGEILEKQKHLMWCPDQTHQQGIISEKAYQQEISEVEFDIDFGDIKISSSNLSKEFATIESKRTHTQMQVALVRIGNALNFRTWIARNDRSIVVGDKQLGQIEGVVQSLDEIPILYSSGIREAASLIDCIWFSADGRFIPAVLEVEHSTGVTSGVTRMLKLFNVMPSITTKFTIVAPNDLRNKVVSEANDIAFRSLDIRYMPYSTVRELYGLISRYALSNVVERSFIEPFMEVVKE